MDFSLFFEPARMQFCEETLTGLIKHPADTWTNISPVIAGLATLIVGRRPLERLLGASALWTGVASAYFHASNTILGETLDLSGMFLFILGIAALQQCRAKPWLDSTKIIGIVIFVAFLLTVSSIFSSTMASPMFAILVVLVVIRGIIDRRYDRWAGAMVGTFIVAWVFWWLDYLHIMCVPDNHHLTAHGVWHLLNGLVFWFTFLHFRNTV